MNAHKTIILFISFLTPFLPNAQTAYQHVSDKRIYSFIDEMASLQIIEVNTAVKPFSRCQIAEWLTQTNSSKDQLTKPQQAQLKIFLQEYELEAGQVKTGKISIIKKDSTFSLHMIPPELSWCDNNFRVLIRPLYGIHFYNNSNDKFYHSYGGLEGIAYINDNWCGYASLRDNHQSSLQLVAPSYFTQESGGNYKNANDFSEMRGGLTYSKKWGSIGLVKDHLEWGDNYNGSNILSGHSPSFTMIKLHLNPVKWLEFDYFHGWLVSQVIDSSRSFVTRNGDFRAVFRQKYIAANMYTFKPFKRLHISVGNAIVYSDVPVQPAYLIPFFFFKSIDHTLNHDIQNQNSMMFLNLSSRQIKHLHLFFSAFIDEFALERIKDKTRNNFTSMKGGLSLTNWPIKNVSLAVEYTKTKPLTFAHYIETTTFESNYFNLGHYLRDNSKEIYVALNFNPVNTLQFKIELTKAMHGNDFEYKAQGAVIPLDELPVLKDKTWTNDCISLRSDFIPFPNLNIYAQFSHSNIKGYETDGKTAEFYLNRFSPLYIHGNTNTLRFGISLGI